MHDVLDAKQGNKQKINNTTEDKKVTQRLSGGGREIKTGL